MQGLFKTSILTFVLTIAAFTGYWGVRYAIYAYATQSYYESLEEARQEGVREYIAKGRCK